MAKTGLNDIRKSFLDFFVSKGHYLGKSASLIPKDDKSILIINSGMAPLKKFFSGAETPPSKRMVTCQKCIRTGDIDNVGKTARHGTFFEMLGNFSFGDYFKKESLNWGYEYLTKVLCIDPDRLWATIYLDDEQAYKIWREIGMPDEHIIRLGKEDNFWEIGLGPCGPDSEIFYDRGEEYGCGKPTCRPGCDCDRYVEIWNHVFTQFSKEEDGSYSDLAHPNIDTGMGLERIACVMQGVNSIFDVDTIRHILDAVLARAGIEYEKPGTESTDVSVRIITDHLRSMVFMIADGIIPSNEGRGYVLRRLIRRAARHGRTLGIESGFLSDLADKVIEVSGEAYPEIVEKRPLIKKVIATEEEKFEKTIDQGQNIINEYVEELKKDGQTVLDGEKTFKLYDTYGFPPELTREILSENGMTADMDGFAEKMKQQKETARGGRKQSDEEGWENNAGEVDLPKTVFTGYEKLEDDGRILLIESKDNSATVYLDKTPFYAESGGQVCDTGIMSTNGAKAEVISVTKSDGVFAHKVKMLEGTFAEGDNVHSSVDVKKRHLTARNHTATHLLQKALRTVLGEHVQQAGSLVNERELRFDFTHYEPLTAEQISEVEAMVNEQISLFVPVKTIETSVEEAEKSGAMALFSEKYGDVVRMVCCGDYSKELCGGTHVANTGEIGAFKIISEAGIASGVRRIEAVTASGIYDSLTEKDEEIDKTCAALKCAPNALSSKAAALADELKEARKALKAAKEAGMSGEIGDIVASAKDVNGAKLITKRFKNTDASDLRELSDKVKQAAGSSAVVFASENKGKVIFLISLTDDLVKKGKHAGKMIKEISSLCGGGGGGRPNFAQAGAPDASKIEEAFDLAESLLR